MPDPQGCCSGPLTVENPYFARSKVLHLMAHFGRASGQDRERIRELYRQGATFRCPGASRRSAFPPAQTPIFPEPYRSVRA